MRRSDGGAPGGLTAEQARECLARDGPNHLEPARRGGLVALLLPIAREPMFLLLLAGAALYLVIGQLAEGALLAAFAVVSVGVVLLQQRRGDRALDALRSLAAPQARVWRDGELVRIPAAQVVAGDWLAVAEGERVAADASLRECTALECDESLLTGESTGVGKRVGDPVFAGTLVASGHGVAQVHATGTRTRMGEIGASLDRIDLAPTPLQRTLKQVTQRLAVAAFAVSALLAVWLGLGTGEWLQGFLSAIALGMALLPEEIPMVLTVFLALGAWRLASIKVLARRPAVIEALGSATVLCVDKTGTLTENLMRLRAVVLPGADVRHDPAEADKDVRAVLACAALASRRGAADPMDRAVFLAADGAAAAGVDPGWQLAHEYPLTPSLPAMAQAWRGPGGQVEVAAKGAPEAVARLCALPADAFARLQAQVAQLAHHGLRVLAVARSGAAPRQVPGKLEDVGFTLLGLVAFADPLRPAVPRAVAVARAAGIAIVMVTGDHPATALEIARQAGIDTAAGALTGDELAALDDAGLARKVATVRVFARIAPLQKLRLVQALQANGETVAMTGDGVNDAPALKAAHIGIAMGVRGTDVAREAAALVLLDEDFTRIVEGVRAGRRIDDNLRKAIFYIVAIHAPIVALAFVPLLLGLPALMLPVHVVMNEMVIDPLCSFAFEGVAEAPGLMRRPPRRPQDHPFRWRPTSAALLAGVLLAATVLAAWLACLEAGRPEPVARTLALWTLNIGNLGLAWMLARPTGARGLAASRSLVAVSLASTGVIVAGMLVPGLRELLHFGLPGAVDLGAGALAGLAAAGASGWGARRLGSRA